MKGVTAVLNHVEFWMKAHIVIMANVESMSNVRGAVNITVTHVCVMRASVMMGTVMMVIVIQRHDVTPTVELRKGWMGVTAMQPSRNVTKGTVMMAPVASIQNVSPVLTLLETVSAMNKNVTNSTATMAPVASIHNVPQTV